MTKIVINTDYGGFSLSQQALRHYATLSTFPTGSGRSGRDIPRDDVFLVETVEVLGAKANGLHAQLKVVEIPNNVGKNWEIKDYDGKEHIAETHRTWS